MRRRAAAEGSRGRRRAPSALARRRQEFITGLTGPRRAAVAPASAGRTDSRASGSQAEERPNSSLNLSVI